MNLALSSLAIAVLAAVLYALFQKSAPTFSLLVSMAAALILLATPDACVRWNLQPRAQWLASASIGAAPETPLLAAIAAARMALLRGAKSLSKSELLAHTGQAPAAHLIHAPLPWRRMMPALAGYTLFGVGYLSFIFNALAANLRHTHIWLSFGPIIERVINSPAQHQIHHSRNPAHFNRNFGTNLSLWDWLFGTLYVTGAKPELLEFGVAPKDNERYMKLHNLVWRPFWVTGLKFWRQLACKHPHQTESPQIK